MKYKYVVLSKKDIRPFVEKAVDYGKEEGN